MTAISIGLPRIPQERAWEDSRRIGRPIFPGARQPFARLPRTLPDSYTA